MNRAEIISRLACQKLNVADGQDYQVRLFAPADAWGVAQLFYAIYSDKYPVADYYDPQRLIELNASGDLISVVASTQSGQVIGHGGFYRGSPPNPGLYEIGLMLILPAYRQTFVSHRIVQHQAKLTEEIPGMQGFFGEAVCNHLITQKIARVLKASECALEIGLMPDGAYEQEGAKGRVSCLVSTRINRDQRRGLFLPQCYHQALGPLLAGLGLDREVAFMESARASQEESKILVRHFEAAGVLRCQFPEIGADFAELILNLEKDWPNEALTQVFLSAGDPSVVYAVRLLRERGYFLGGIYPIWFGQDALLMQKLRVPVDFESILLLTDKAKQFLAEIKLDYLRASGSA